MVIVVMVLATVVILLLLLLLLELSGLAGDKVGVQVGFASESLGAEVAGVGPAVLGLVGREFVPPEVIGRE